MRPVIDKRMIVAALSVAIAGALGVAGCARVSEPDVKQSNSASDQTSSTPQADYKRRMNDEWLKGRARYTDPRSAEKDLPFTLKLPDPSFVESPAIIYVRKASKLAPAEAYVSFGSKLDEGVRLIAVKTWSKQDFKAYIAQDRADRESGAARSDKAPVLVKVNGLQALGIEPGVNYGAPRGTDQRPGFVQWWDGYVHYIIFGTRGRDGTSLATLIEIAESLR